MKLAKLALATFFIGFLYGSNANATGVFSDDFESGLDAWTGASGGAHSGVIVNDPIRPNNKVLKFNKLSSGGDIFTRTLFTLDQNYTYIISFEYLGQQKTGSVAGNIGGFAGLAEGLPGRHMWYYGTATDGGATDILIDDGKWHLYTFYFRPNVSFPAFGGSSNKVHLMFEDFSGPGIAGDALFDNIHIEKTPLVPANSQLMQPVIQQ